MGYYRIFTGSNEHFYFNLTAGNHGIISQSQGCTAKSSAENGIESVRRNAVSKANFDCREPKDDHYSFVLKPGNGEIIGVSEMYQQKTRMENAIHSVMENGRDSPVKDQV